MTCRAIIFCNMIKTPKPPEKNLIIDLKALNAEDLPLPSFIMLINQMKNTILSNN